MIDPNLVGLVMAVGVPVVMAGGGFLYSAYDPTKVASIKLRTVEGEFEPVIDAPRKKHGLIVLGDPGKSKGFENTSNLVYRTLKEHGYERDNLFVLEGKDHPTERFDCHTLPSSNKHLQEVLDHLYGDVNSDDVFFLYVLSHGDKTADFLPMGQSTLLLDNGVVAEKELEELLSDLHPNHSITYFNSCYSGGFARRLGKGRNIAISTSRRDKFTSGYVGPNVIKQHGPYVTNFTLNFFSALRRQFPNGDRIVLDDGSIDGVFDFASERSHQADKHQADIGALSKYLSPISKNTPHLVYCKIDPKEVRL